MSMSTAMIQTMIGDRCPEGPGGRDCTCCGQAPGGERKVARRKQKRSEKQSFRREIREYLAV